MLLNLLFAYKAKGVAMPAFVEDRQRMRFSGPVGQSEHSTACDRVCRMLTICGEHGSISTSTTRNSQMVRVPSAVKGARLERSQTHPESKRTFRRHQHV